eukprot:scaffold1931_cov77-Cylindrotheca_fusiformis.AAC.3
MGATKITNDDSKESERISKPLFSESNSIISRCSNKGKKVSWKPEVSWKTCGIEALSSPLVYRRNSLTDISATSQSLGNEDDETSIQSLSMLAVERIEDHREKGESNLLGSFQFSFSSFRLDNVSFLRIEECAEEVDILQEEDPLEADCNSCLPCPPKEPNLLS